MRTLLLDKEDGFSLVELAVALGLAVILSGIAVTMSPSFIDDIKDTVEINSDCSFERESVAKKFLDGEEPTNINEECNLVPGGQQ